MIVFSIAFFSVSLFLLVAFLVGKCIELKTGVVVAPTWRSAADTKARQLKELALRGEVELEQLPSHVWVLSRRGIHTLALLIARFARVMEERAHKLADFVSHKHGFERREVRSEFLKNALNAKNGNGQNGTNGPSRV